MVQFQSFSERNEQRNHQTFSIFNFILTLNLPQIVKISLLFITAITLVITNIQINNKINIQNKKDSNVKNNVTCFFKNFSGALDLSAEICKLSNNSAQYFVIKIDNSILYQFNAHESYKFIEWLKNCEIESLERPNCPLIATETVGCWYEANFGGGTSLCFDHNYSFDYMVIGGFRLYNSNSKKLISFLLANYTV